MIAFRNVAMVLLLGILAHDANAQMIKGTATYRERMALPPGAMFEATIEDVSRADAAASIVATTRLTSPGNPPIAFTIPYDKAKIVDTGRYVVRARILVDGKLLFTSDTASLVITGGHSNDVSVLLRRVGSSASSGPSRTSAEETLVGPYWKAVELAGTPVPALPANREPHLVFAVGGRFSGSDGCNRLTGAYTLKGNGVTLGPAAGTQMACLDTADVAQRFRSALKGTSHWSMVENRVQLLGATGKPLAVFERGMQTPSSTSGSPLEGTMWQLVKFQGGDDKTVTPDPAKYSVDFGSGGRLTARIDCNRGNGTWKANASNQLELGPLALTRAKCAEGSLHDQIVKQWTYIRSFLIKDGHLFLVLMADGGTYEFEPRGSNQ